MAEKQSGPDQQLMTEENPDDTKQVDGTDQEQPDMAAEVEPESQSGPAELQAQLEEAVKAAEQHKDLALRTQAELQNVRRRAERDVEHAHKYGLEKMIQELLPVVDNLERALEASGEDNEFAKALREGVELTLTMFLKALASFKVEPVNPEGEPFDPALHQAVTMIEQANVEPNTVVHVMQKGYTLHGRIVRPAMVAVAKAAAQGGAPKEVPKIDEQA